MKLAFTLEAWDEYLFWQQHDTATTKRINSLIQDIIRSPFAGLGHPEPLKHEFSGWWSRRIDRQLRLVYAVEDDGLLIIQCRFHY